MEDNIEDFLKYILKRSPQWKKKIVSCSDVVTTFKEDKISTSSSGNAEGSSNENTEPIMYSIQSSLSSSEGDESRGSKVVCSLNHLSNSVPCIISSGLDNGFENNSVDCGNLGHMERKMTRGAFSKEGSNSYAITHQNKIEFNDSLVIKPGAPLVFINISFNAPISIICDERKESTDREKSRSTDAGDTVRLKSRRTVFFVDCTFCKKPLSKEVDFFMTGRDIPQRDFFQTTANRRYVRECGGDWEKVDINFHYDLYDLISNKEYYPTDRPNEHTQSLAAVKVMGSAEACYVGCDFGCGLAGIGVWAVEQSLLYVKDCSCVGRDVFWAAFLFHDSAKVILSHCTIDTVLGCGVVTLHHSTTQISDSVIRNCGVSSLFALCDSEVKFRNCSIEYSFSGINMTISCSSNVELERCDVTTQVPVGVSGSTNSMIVANSNMAASMTASAVNVDGNVVLSPAARAAAAANNNNYNNNNNNNNNNNLNTLNNVNMNACYEQILHRDLFIEFADKYLSASKMETILPSLESTNNQSLIAVDHSSLVCQECDFQSKTLDEIIQLEVEHGRRAPTLLLNSPIMSALLSSRHSLKSPNGAANLSAGYAGDPNAPNSLNGTAVLLGRTFNPVLEELIVRLYSCYYTVRRCWAEFLLQERELYVRYTQVDGTINLVDCLNDTVAKALLEKTKTVLASSHVAAVHTGSESNRSSLTTVTINNDFASSKHFLLDRRDMAPVELWSCERWYTELKRGLEERQTPPSRRGDSHEGEFTGSDEKESLNPSSPDDSNHPHLTVCDAKQNALENSSYFSVVAGAHPVLLRGNYFIVARDAATLSLRCNIFRLRSRQPPKSALKRGKGADDGEPVEVVVADPIQVRSGDYPPTIPVEEVSASAAADEESTVLDDLLKYVNPELELFYVHQSRQTHNAKFYHHTQMVSRMFFLPLSEDVGYASAAVFVDYSLFRSLPRHLCSVFGLIPSISLEVKPKIPLPEDDRGSLASTYASITSSKDREGGQALDLAIQEFRRVVRQTFGNMNQLPLCSVETTNNILRYEAPLQRIGDRREKSMTIPLEDDSSCHSSLLADHSMLEDDIVSRGSSPVGNSWGLVVLSPSCIPKCPAVLSLANTPLRNFLQNADEAAVRLENDWKRVGLIDATGAPVIDPETQEPKGNEGNVFLHVQEPSRHLVHLWTQQVCTHLDEFAAGAALSLFKLYEYCSPLPLPQFQEGLLSPSMPASPVFSRSPRGVPPEVLDALGDLSPMQREAFFGRTDSVNLLEYSTSSSSSSSLSTILSSLGSASGLDEGDGTARSHRRKYSVSSPAHHERSRRRSQHPSVVDPSANALVLPSETGEKASNATAAETPGEPGAAVPTLSSSGCLSPFDLNQKESNKATKEPEGTEDSAPKKKTMSSPAYTALTLIDPDNTTGSKIDADGTENNLVFVSTDKTEKGFEETDKNSTEEDNNKQLLAPPAFLGSPMSSFTSSSSSEEESINIDDILTQAQQQQQRQQQQHSPSPSPSAPESATKAEENLPVLTTFVVSETVEEKRELPQQRDDATDEKAPPPPPHPSSNKPKDDDDDEEAEDDTVTVFNLLKGFIRGDRTGRLDDTLNKSDKVSFRESIKLNFNRTARENNDTDIPQEEAVNNNNNSTNNNTIEDNHDRDSREQKEENEVQVAQPTEKSTSSTGAGDVSLTASVPPLMGPPTTSLTPSNSAAFNSVKESSLGSKSQSIAGMKGTVQYLLHSPPSVSSHLHGANSQMNSHLSSAMHSPKDDSPTAIALGSLDERPGPPPLLITVYEEPAKDDRGHPTSATGGNNNSSSNHNNTTIDSDDTNNTISRTHNSSVSAPFSSPLRENPPVEHQFDAEVEKKNLEDSTPSSKQVITSANFLANQLHSSELTNVTNIPDFLQNHSITSSNLTYHKDKDDERNQHNKQNNNHSNTTDDPTSDYAGSSKSSQIHYHGRDGSGNKFDAIDSQEDDDDDSDNDEDREEQEKGKATQSDHPTEHRSTDTIQSVATTGSSLNSNRVNIDTTALPSPTYQRHDDDDENTAAKEKGETTTEGPLSHGESDAPPLPKDDKDREMEGKGNRIVFHLVKSIDTNGSSSLHQRLHPHSSACPMDESSMGPHFNSTTNLYKCASSQPSSERSHSHSLPLANTESTGEGNTEMVTETGAAPLQPTEKEQRQQQPPPPVEDEYRTLPPMMKFLMSIMNEEKRRGSTASGDLPAAASGEGEETERNSNSGSPLHPPKEISKAERREVFSEVPPAVVVSTPLTPDPEGNHVPLSGGSYRFGEEENVGEDDDDDDDEEEVEYEEIEVLEEVEEESEEEDEDVSYYRGSSMNSYHHFPVGQQDSSGSVGNHSTGSSSAKTNNSMFLNLSPVEVALTNLPKKRRSDNHHRGGNDESRKSSKGDASNDPPSPLADTEKGNEQREREDRSLKTVLDIDTSPSLSLNNTLNNTGRQHVNDITNSINQLMVNYNANVANPYKRKGEGQEEASGRMDSPPPSSIKERENTQTEETITKSLERVEEEAVLRAVSALQKVEAVRILKQLDHLRKSGTTTTATTTTPPSALPQEEMEVEGNANPTSTPSYPSFSSYEKSVVQSSSHKEDPHTVNDQSFREAASTEIKMVHESTPLGTPIPTTSSSSNYNNNNNNNNSRTHHQVRSPLVESLNKKNVAFHHTYDSIPSEASNPSSEELQQKLHDVAYRRSTVNPESKEQPTASTVTTTTQQDDGEVDYPPTSKEGSGAPLVHLPKPLLSHAGNNPGSTTDATRNNENSKDGSEEGSDINSGEYNKNSRSSTQRGEVAVNLSLELEGENSSDWRRKNTGIGSNHGRDSADVTVTAPLPAPPSSTNAPFTPPRTEEKESDSILPSSAAVTPLRPLPPSTPIGTFRRSTVSSGGPDSGGPPPPAGHSVSPPAGSRPSGSPIFAPSNRLSIASSAHSGLTPEVMVRDTVMDSYWKEIISSTVASPPPPSPSRPYSGEGSYSPKQVPYRHSPPPSHYDSFFSTSALHGPPPPSSFTNSPLQRERGSLCAPGELTASTHPYGPEDPAPSALYGPVSGGGSHPSETPFSMLLTMEARRRRKSSRHSPYGPSSAADRTSTTVNPPGSGYTPWPMFPFSSKYPKERESTPGVEEEKEWETFWDVPPGRILKGQPSQPSPPLREPPAASTAVFPTPTRPSSAAGAGAHRGRLSSRRSGGTRGRRTPSSAAATSLLSPASPSSPPRPRSSRWIDCTVSLCRSTRSGADSDTCEQDHLPLAAVPSGPPRPPASLAPARVRLSPTRCSSTTTSASPSPWRTPSVLLLLLKGGTNRRRARPHCSRTRTTTLTTRRRRRTFASTSRATKAICRTPPTATARSAPSITPYSPTPPPPSTAPALV